MPYQRLEMAVRIPGERRHAVAERDAGLLQRLGDAARAGMDGAIVRPADRPFHGARDDFAVAVIERGMIENFMDQQRPVLHQTQH